jgi:hypothetical protein
MRKGKEVTTKGKKGNIKKKERVRGKRRTGE